MIPYEWTIPHQFKNRVIYMQGISKKNKWKKNRRK